MRRLTQRGIPAVDGWYWIEYIGESGLIQCPAEVCRLGQLTIIKTARNDMIEEDRRIHGPGLRLKGKFNDSVRFGPLIPFPN